MEGTVRVELKDIYKIYQMGDTVIRANDGINFKILDGEFVAIIGKSGSGKSTIMNIIGALDTPTSGQYFLNNQDVSRMKDDQLAEIRNKQIGFIFQNYNLLNKQNILENVELPLLYAGVKERERRKRALEALEKVDMKEKWRVNPNKLSGGQQQRVAIARALVNQPSLILADEPTGALDSRTSREVMGLLKQLHQEGNTIILITHDQSIALEADRIIQILDGKIIFDGLAREYRNETTTNH